MNVLDGTDVIVATPYFICAQAERQQTPDAESSKPAQLLAQIRAVQIQRFTSSYFFTNRK